MKRRERTSGWTRVPFLIHYKYCHIVGQMSLFISSRILSSLVCCNAVVQSLFWYALKFFMEALIVAADTRSVYTAIRILILHYHHDPSHPRWLYSQTLKYYCFFSLFHPPLHSFPWHHYLPSFFFLSSHASLTIPNILLFSFPPPCCPFSLLLLDLKREDNVRGGRVLAAVSVSEVKQCKAQVINDMWHFRLLLLTSSVSCLLYLTQTLSSFI